MAILFALGLGVFSWYIYNLIFAPNTAFAEETVDIYVPTGASYGQLRKQLVPLLEDIEAFDMVAGKKGYVSNVKAGHFVLQKGMNNNEMVNVLRSTNVPVWVTFNNQERLEDLAGRVAGQIEADSLALLESMRDSAFLDANEFDGRNALSMYVPNKYEFYWNTSAEEFRDRMLREYESFLDAGKASKSRKYWAFSKAGDGAGFYCAKGNFKG